MAWTTPGTATAGEVLTAAFWNANVRDNLNAIRNSTGIVPPSAFVYNTGNKAVTSTTPFQWDEELYDTDGIFTKASSASRLTCKTAGLYIVTSNVLVQVTVANCTNHEYQILFNGNAVSGERVSSTVVNGEFIIHSITWMRTMSVNDYVECVLSFTGGTHTRINDGRNNFAMTMLGATS